MAKFAVANNLLSDLMPDLTNDATTDLLTTNSDINAKVFNEALANIASSSGDTEEITKQWLSLAALLEISPSSRTLLAESISSFISSYENLESLLPVFENRVFEFMDIDSAIGSSGVDTIVGSESEDVMVGFGDNDKLYGRGSNDILYGNDGNDYLYGDDGNDILNGGEGRDYLYGGSGAGDYLSGDAGNDTYLFGTGDGNTTVYNRDTDVSSVDIARFEDTTIENLWFSRSGNNLQLTVAGTDDQVTITNWYSNANYQLDQVEVGDSVLLNTQVELLVSAMASYSVPIGAGNVIPQDVKDELQPVLTETWQTTLI